MTMSFIGHWAVVAAVLLSCQLGCFVLSAAVPEQSDTLRVVATLFRHGARTPGYPPYANDPYKNYVWLDGKGGLTISGKQMMFELGKKLRRQYADFLSDQYSEAAINTRSSAVTRCMMSAALVLAGLYPPLGRQVWSEELDWQPIPVFSIPKESDNMLACTKNCHIRSAIMAEVFLSYSSDPAFADLYEFLSIHAGEDIVTSFQFMGIYDTLLTQRDYGLELPDWANEVFPDKMIPGMLLSNKLWAYNSTMNRLTIGPMIADIKERFDARISGKNVDTKLYIYSAHDLNVISLWRALGIEELIIPDYGSNIILELHEDLSGDYFVKTLFRNNTSVEEPLEIILPFCGSPCPYKDFVLYIDDLIPRDWEAECENY